MISPTQRTLAELRKLGYMAAVVEHWNPHARIRQDLFGFVDVVAVGGGERELVVGEGLHTLAVQATSGSNVASRLTKLRSQELAPRVEAVKAAGWRVEVWGWRKSAKSRRWELRRETV